jgi:hypothetical protein
MAAIALCALAAGTPAANAKAAYRSSHFAFLTILREAVVGDDERSTGP